MKSVNKSAYMSMLVAACLFCGSTHNLSMFRGKQICFDCLRQLREG